MPGAAGLLWTLGGILVVLGLVAALVGWDAVLWLPTLLLDLVLGDPFTAGLIALGVGLMVVARVIGFRR